MNLMSKWRRHCVSLLFLLLPLLAAPQRLYPQLPSELNAVENYERGLAALADFNTERAIEFFQRALNINPNYFSALYQLAYSYWLLGEYDQSQKIAQQARRYSYENVELQVLLARIGTALGNYEEARRRYRELLADYPRDITLQIGLAELLLAQGRFREAIKAFENILRLDSGNQQAYLSLAALYGWEGRINESEDAIEQALEIAPLHFYTQYNAGRHYLNRNLLRAAQHHAAIAADIAPGNPASLVLLLEIALAQGNLSAANALAERLIALEPQSIEYWYARGIVQAEMQNYEGALFSFRRALLIRSDAELPRIASEQLFRQNGDIAPEQRNAFAQYRFARGRQFQERNLLVQALREYRRGLQIDPLSFEGREEFANIQLQLGNRATYLQELEVLAELGRNNREINDRIETFRSLLSNSVAIQWGVDQFTIPRELILLEIVIDQQRSNGSYRESFRYVGEWLLDLFRAQENVAVNNQLSIVRSSSEAHTRARRSGSDYYLYLTIEEFARSILLRAELKSSRTGSTIRNYRAVYRGSDSIQRASHYLVSKVVGDLPVRAQLIDRRNNRALINIGSLHGAEEGATLVVASRGAISVALEEPRLVFASDRIAGRCQIVRVDDLVSEVTLVRDTLFDNFSIGDEVIFPRHAETVIRQEEFPNPIYERLRLIR